MSEQELARVSLITVTPQHFSSVLRPHQMPSGDLRYAIRVPAETFPEVQSKDRLEDELGPMVNVSSKHPPVVLPGNGEDAEFDWWEKLIARATRWGYPLDRLLWGRPVQVVGAPWYSNNIQWGSPSWYASLIAIRVGGDLINDEGLVAHIADIRRKFDV